MYYLYDVQPIEEAGFEFGNELYNNKPKNANMGSIINIISKIANMQQKINDGEIQIADQHEAFKRSKAEYDRLIN